MNYNFVLDKLEQWDEDELIYREYYYLSKNQDSLDSFRIRHADAPSYLKIALFPDEISSFREEEDFISLQHNVSLVKHPRYFPLFYHKHAFFEMIYVVSGQCTQRFQLQDIQLSQGDICILSPEVRHGIEVYDDSIILNIVIRKSTFLDIFMNTIRDKSQIGLFFLGNTYAKKNMQYMLFHTKKDFSIRNAIFDMYLEQLHADEFSDRIICSQLTIFFAQLTRKHKKNLEIPEAHLSNSNADKLINYILNNYNSVTLEELSRQFHYSSSYCASLIKKSSGYSFTDLVTSIRLQHGENLLLLTPLSIAEISEKLGYKNPETFIRMFKRYHKMSPSQYRKQHP